MKLLMINSQADLDIDREALFLAERSGEDTAFHFYESCEESFTLLQTYPQLGKVRSFRNVSLEVRVWRVKSFTEYLVFYRILPNAVEVLRVIHGARDIETIFSDEFAD